MNLEDKVKLKVLFVGDAGVGKTSIITKKIKGSFSYTIEPTVGASHLSVEVNKGGRPVDLMIWDTAGQEQYHSFINISARNSNVSVIVASAVDHLSISNIIKWKDQLIEISGEHKMIVVINKIDLIDEEGAALDEICDHLSKTFDDVYRVSALKNISIDELFYRIAQIGLSSESLYNMDANYPNSGIIISSNVKSAESCC